MSLLTTDWLMSSWRTMPVVAPPVRIALMYVSGRLVTSRRKNETSVQHATRARNRWSTALSEFLHSSSASITTTHVRVIDGERFTFFTTNPIEADRSRKSKTVARCLLKFPFIPAGPDVDPDDAAGSNVDDGGGEFGDVVYLGTSDTDEDPWDADINLDSQLLPSIVTNTSLPINDTDVNGGVLEDPSMPEEIGECLR